MNLRYYFIQENLMFNVLFSLFDRKKGSLVMVNLVKVVVE